MHSTSSPSPARFLSEADVRLRTSLSRSSLWRLRRNSEFPEPVQLTAQRVGWLEADIDAWISARVAAAAAQRAAVDD